MKFLRDVLDKQEKNFKHGGKLEKFYPLYEALDTFLFTPHENTNKCSHVRDGIDLKRTMITVVWALIPCILMAMYNTGFQANLALEKITFETSDLGWRQLWLQNLGIGLSSTSILSCFVHGALYFLPIFLVTNIVGGLWEVLFASVRKHEINEGFMVTGMLFPLTLPATIPLWQVALGISFGVVFAKEVFGGTGRNIFNPALMARAFLFFAYPAQISGAQIWVGGIDGYTAATALSQAAEGGLSSISFSWMDSFLGFIPGSMGETSTLACLLGAAYLIITGVASWRIMLSGLLGLIFMSFIFNTVGSTTNVMFSLPWYWHFVLGSFAFGIVFMATDPVSAALTQKGQLFYGFFIGCMGLIIRVANPAYPEGWMLAILFGNAVGPFIDYIVVQGNIKRRMKRWNPTA